MSEWDPLQLHPHAGKVLPLMLPRLGIFSFGRFSRKKISTIGVLIESQEAVQRGMVQDPLLQGST